MNCRIKCIARYPDARRDLTVRESLNPGHLSAAKNSSMNEPFGGILSRRLKLYSKSRSYHHGACSSCTYRMCMKCAARTRVSRLEWMSADLLQHFLGVYRLYVTSPEFHSCKILFPSKPVVRAIQVPYIRSLQS